MKITSIEYRETRTFGEYQNVTVGLAGELLDGDNGDDAFDDLKACVQGKLAQRVAEEEATRQHRWEESKEQRAVREKSFDLQAIENNIATAKAQWAKCEEFMARHGVKIDEELPF